jgi:hypothetical protein
MESDRSNLFSNLEINHYSQLNASAESMLAIEKEHFHSSTSSPTDTYTSEKGIMVALGFIATLLLCSGIQLYRSMNVNPVRVKGTKSNRAFTLKSRNLKKKIHLSEFNNFAKPQEIETSAIQNSISHGKF